VSDLVACPTCQSTLRLPADAATVRCPKCKTLLEVTTTEVPAPPPAAAKPLPFAPVKAKAKAKPAAGPATTNQKHRPELVDEELEAEQQKAKEAKAEAERKREVRKEIAAMDAKEEAEEEQYDDAKERCSWGRSALQTLRWSLVGYIFSMVVGYMVLLPLVGLAWIFNEKDIFGAFGMALPGFSLLVAFGSLLGTGVGFALAIRGPKEAMHIAIMGLVAVAAQLICMGGTVGNAMTAADRYVQTPSAQTGYPEMEIAYVMLGTATNLQTTTDSPVRLAFNRIYGQYEVPWVNVAVGLFEFTRLLLVCMLVQRYAELGKADNVAAESPKTVNRVFFVLLTFALFRGATCVGFDWFQDGTGWYIGQVIHLCNFEFCFLCIAVRLLTQFRVISDTEDVLIPDRVASRFDTFNEV
jgi:LSD1 subclass zinc finger protein